MPSAATSVIVSAAMAAPPASTAHEAGPAGQARVRPRTLFLAFLRLGLTSFGGPAMVAYVKELAVRKKGWIGAESFDDGVALCQSLPGATAMQSTAYVGLQAGGFAGAGAAYIGFCLPAFVVMLVLSVLYRFGQDAPLILSLFAGLRAIVVAIMANAVINFGRTTIKTWAGFLLVAGAAAALYFMVNPIYVIFGAAAAGLLLPQPPLPTYAESDNAPRRESHLRPLTVLLGISAVIMALLFAFESQLFTIALTMLRVDVFAFGGGFASIPLMQHEVVDVHHWMAAPTFIDGIALGQVTPGPIVITATFVGYLVAGIAGTFVATAAIFLPSFSVLVLVEPYYSRLKDNRYFRRAVLGILLSFVGLILAVTIRLGTSIEWQTWSILLAAAAFAALRLKIDILWVVLAGGLISLIVGLF